MMGDTADPWGEGGPNNSQAAWREREQRQRSLRFPLMFLLMMLLMDGEEQNQQRRNSDGNSSRKKIRGKELGIAQSVYLERRQQDAVIQSVVREHHRYKYLMERNGGEDIFEVLHKWKVLNSDNTSVTPHRDDVWIFPGNTTGNFYGSWFRFENPKSSLTEEKTPRSTIPSGMMDVGSMSIIPSEVLLEFDRLQSIGVHNLPQGSCLSPQNSSAQNAVGDSDIDFKRKELSEKQTPKASLSTTIPSLTLTKDGGKVAFHFFSRRVSGVEQISIVDGFAKIYDTTTPGYSTGRDIVLPLKGIYAHALGRISLVSRTTSGRAALFLKGLHKSYLHGPSQDLPSGDQKQLFSPEPANETGGAQKKNSTMIDETVGTNNVNTSPTSENEDLMRQLGDLINVSSLCDEAGLIFPYPFVADDKDQTLRRIPSQALRPKSRKEQLLESNAGDCEFEFTLDVREEAWNFNELIEAVSKEPNTFGHMNSELESNLGSGRVKASERKKLKNSNRERHFVMAVNGTIFSPNCGNFTANLNATALRADADRPADSAMNYSFYMMLTCLTQIVLLLRQLLHTQAQGAANKVSLVCIGWQAVLDAVLCLTHVYLSVTMPFAFTALASVAFFKLLIFCVVELKFMAIILQARTSNSPGNSAENLRRQITRLHIGFYLSLGLTLVSLFYSWASYRRICILSLYSFWVPQIFRNVATESKRSLRRQYIYGMSLTRLLAPLVAFSTDPSFLRDVFPGTLADTRLFQLLILWIGIQIALLEAQDRFGARFMIPARFLPPKFDYFRPIPAHLLAHGSHMGTPSEVVPRLNGQSNGSRARHRNRGTRNPKVESGMTTDMSRVKMGSSPRLNCVICYNDIEIQNRQSYMLAPCDHIFHKECLLRWMEVKMECPVCRTDLPAL